MTKSIFLFIAVIFFYSLPANAEITGLTTKTVKSIDGKIINLDETIGVKPVYLKFWATWCIPCRKQMPHLQKSFEQYGNSVETIAININMNDSLEAIKITQQEFQLTMPIIMEQGAELSQAFNLRATPYHVLINKEGKIIHTGHDASAELDNKLKLMAAGQSENIKAISLNKGPTKKHLFNLRDNKPTLLYFTSAWCDWYLEKSRPNMSSKCIHAQKTVNYLSKKFSAYQWQGVLTRLWTGEDELNDYKKKYNVPFPMWVDSTNEHFFDFKVDTFPTLIAFKNGKEIFRTDQFNDTQKLQKKLKSLATTEPAE